MENEDLVEWIKQNMTIDDKIVLLANKEKIAEFVGLSTNGDIIIKIDKSKKNAQQLILIYLIGKFYSKIVGYSDTHTITNTELSEEMGIPKGTISWSILQLTKNGLIKNEKSGHSILLSAILPALKKIEEE
jgi:hypothetical protein